MKKSSLKANYIYNTLYQLLAIFLPLITTPYLSRVLGATNIGIFSYAYSVVYYFSLFILLGLKNYGNRAIAQVSDKRGERSKTFWSIYIFQILMTVLISFLYILYCFVISDTTKLSLILYIYLLSAGLDINWLFFGLEKFKMTTIRSSAFKLLSLIGIFVFVKNENDLYKYALVYAVGMLLSQLILWVGIAKEIDFVKVTKCDVVSHIKPNLLLFIPVVAISLYQVMDKVMLGILANKTEVGYYESCDKIMQIPTILVFSLGTVMLPKISNLMASNKKEDSLKYLEKSLLFAIFISSALSFGIMGVAKEFVPFFYGDGFEKCIEVFQFLMPSCVFMAFANVIRTQYLIPSNRDVPYIVSVFSGAVVNLVINACLIGKYGATGAAIGTLAAQAAVCIIQSLYSMKELQTVRYIGKTIPFVLIGVGMYILLCRIEFHYSDIINLIIKVLVGGSVYIACSALFFFLNILETRND